MKSETGSGKTLAYLVPLIEHLSKKSLQEEKINRENGTYCIIFSPTRELCLQIEIELKKILKLFNYIVSGTIIGGENPKKEKARMRKGLNIIICTPGRFLYHLQNTESLNLSRLCYLIFDEADRILDLGFEKEMNQCLDLIKKKAISKFNNNNGTGSNYADFDVIGSIPKQIQQYYIEVPTQYKLLYLIAFLFSH